MLGLTLTNSVRRLRLVNINPRTKSVIMSCTLKNITFSLKDILPIELETYLKKIKF